MKLRLRGFLAFLYKLESELADLNFDRVIKKAMTSVQESGLLVVTILVTTLKWSLPEDLPRAPSIRKMIEERNKAVSKKQLKIAEKQNGQQKLF